MLARAVVAAAARAGWVFAGMVMALAGAAARRWRLAKACRVIVSLAVAAVNDTLLGLVGSHSADCIVDADRPCLD